MQKLFAIALIALFAVSCTGSKGCGCPSWGDIPNGIQQDIQATETAAGPSDYLWN